MLAGDGGQLGNGLDGADLVVGEHDGGERGVGADGRLEIGGAHQAVLVHGQVGHLEALLLQGLAGVEHRMVLDGARDEVLALAGVGAGESLDGPVVRLGAAARDVHLAGRGANKTGQRLAGIGHGIGSLLAERVDGRGVAELLGEVRQHGLHHLRAHRRG